MKNFHLIHVKYHGATNTMGSRVSLYSERFQKRLYISFDYAKNDIADMAEEKLSEFCFHIIGQGESMGGSCIIITDTFRTLEKAGECSFCTDDDRKREPNMYVLPNGKCSYHNLMHQE